MVVMTSKQESVPPVSILAGAVLCLTGADLMGWWLGIPLLTSMIPHYATMKPNTALCMGLLAIAVLLRMRDEQRRQPAWRPAAAIGAAAFSLTISGASLAEYVSGKNFGIDQWLAVLPTEHFGDPAGRMAMGTAACIVVTAAAIVVLDWVPRLSTALLLGGIVLSGSGIIGFLFRSGPLIDVFWFKSLAVHTACGLLLVQAAGLAVRPEREPFCTLTQQRRSEGKRRYLLIAVVAVPVLLALPVLAGMRVGLYDPRFAMALLVVVLVGVQTLTLWQDGLSLGRVEDSLRESDAESSRILLSIGDGVVVTDAEGLVVRMNSVAEELTGWPIAEARGRALSDVFPIFSDATGKTIENPVDKVKRFGTAVGLENHSVLRHRAGFTTHIDDSSAPIRDDEGKLTGIVLVFRNVDERKLAEARLSASDNKLRAALSAAQLGSWEVDLAAGQMECSALCKANFGRRADEAFSYEDLFASIHPDDLADTREAIQKAIDEHGVYRSEYRVTWPDESMHWIVASGQLLNDEFGNATRMVGVTLDVTERHRSAAALMESEKLAAVGRLAASISHEINNPLEAVTNLLYLVRHHSESAEIQDYITVAERELHRVAVITNQTLRFHKQSTNPSPVLCEDLIASVLQMYQGKIVNSQLRIETRNRTTMPLVCFEGEVRQVLSNLIGNAIDAMKSGNGILLLRSRNCTNWKTGQMGVAITVADSGSGMSAKTVQRIFEPFYTTKGIAGTGLGLWISYEIVARHSGAIRVRSSQATGRHGTVFSVFLPLDAAMRP